MGRAAPSGDVTPRPRSIELAIHPVWKNASQAMQVPPCFSSEDSLAPYGVLCHQASRKLRKVCALYDGKCGFRIRFDCSDRESSGRRRHEKRDFVPSVSESFGGFSELSGFPAKSPGARVSARLKSAVARPFL